MKSAKKIVLRPVTEADAEFLRSVYASTRAEELARVPWPPEQKEAFVRLQFAAQKRHYAAEYPQANHEIICADGIPVGRVYLDRSGEDFHILDITVLPQHRHAGIGSFLLRQILEEAAKAGKTVGIYVETYNPSLHLFERLGFQKVKEDGLQFLMRWKVPSF